MPSCPYCYTECTDAHYQRVIYNKTELYGPWAGWRMAGKCLVAPTGDRINPQRLAGILWQESLRKRYAVKGASAGTVSPVIILAEGLQASVVRLGREASP